MAIEKKPFSRLVVAIPTKDRPELLEKTLRSLLEHARKFGHEIEIVVSDASSPANAERNLNTIAMLRKKRFARFRLHYYKPGAVRPLSILSAQASDEEKRTLAEIVETHAGTQVGANRNRLALLSVMHGGKDAAYLLIDDDCRITAVSPKGRIMEARRNLFAAFEDKLVQAMELGKLGYAGWIMHAEPEGAVFRASKNEHGAGTGRIVCFEAMLHPYKPAGVGEDLGHSQAIGGLHYDDEFHAGKTPYVVHEVTESRAPHDTPRTMLPRVRITREHIRNWLKLVQKMVDVGTRR